MPARGALDIEFYTNGHFDPMLTLASKAWFVTSERLNRLEEPLAQAIPVVVSEIYQNFAAQGRPVRWPPLSDETLASKARKGTVDRGMLVDSGDMFDEATNELSWTYDRRAYNEVEVNMPEPTEYAHFHTEGTMNMPQRDFLFLPEEAVAEIDGIFRAWISGVTFESLNA